MIYEFFIWPAPSQCPEFRRADAELIGDALKMAREAGHIREWETNNVAQPGRRTAVIIYVDAPAPLRPVFEGLPAHLQATSRPADVLTVLDLDAFGRLGQYSFVF